MTIALGLWYSLAIGVGDHFGGYATKRSQALTVVITALIGGTITCAVGLAVVASELTTRDLALGAASGMTVGFALMLMYHGMSLSSAAVVSPIVAVVGALFPVAWDVSTGASLPGVVVAGIAVAVAGLGLSTISPELGDRVRVGAMWAIASGCGFGVSLSLLGETDADSGIWPAVSQRAIACALLTVIALFRSQTPLVPRGLRSIAVLSGVLGGSGVAAFAIGAQRGSLSEVAVASAMFPAVTAILGAVFDDHPLRWWQLIGIGGAVAGIALIATG